LKGRLVVIVGDVDQCAALENDIRQFLNAERKKNLHYLDQHAGNDFVFLLGAKNSCMKRGPPVLVWWYTFNNDESTVPSCTSLAALISAFRSMHMATHCTDPISVATYRGVLPSASRVSTASPLLKMLSSSVALFALAAAIEGGTTLLSLLRPRPSRFTMLMGDDRWGSFGGAALTGRAYEGSSFRESRAPSDNDRFTGSSGGDEYDDGCDGGDCDWSCRGDEISIAAAGATGADAGAGLAGAADEDTGKGIVEGAVGLATGETGEVGKDFTGEEGAGTTEIGRG